MKTFGNIGNMRLLDIRVILNDKDIIYEGTTENAPADIKAMAYSKIEMKDKHVLYVYN